MVPMSVVSDWVRAKLSTAQIIWYRWLGALYCRQLIGPVLKGDLLVLVPLPNNRREGKILTSNNY